MHDPTTSLVWSRRESARMAVLLALSCSLGSAWAQGYPSKPVRIVVPWPGGGLVDVAARQLSPRLQAALGQPVVVDNRVGAGGAIGADAVAKAAPDGHTLLFTTSALTMGAAMKARTPFDLLRDFEPLCLMAHAPQVLVVGPNINPGSVKDLVELARSRPGRLSYGSAGVGSPAHFAGELFKSLQGLYAVHIPYTGAPAAMNDQLAGRVDFQFANTAVALPQIRAGKVKALAVSGQSRFAALPEVPTMVEAGVPQFEASQWLGLLAPRGLPAAVKERLVVECNKTLASEEVRSVLMQSGMSAAPAGSAAGFDAALRAELDKWSQLARRANIQPD
jgi:tripartite-type tricarboxylate transporter receptor subunit TctC